MKIGLTLRTSSPTLSVPSTSEPFYILLTARILATPQPHVPITLWTHLSPLYGLRTRAFDNITCTTNDKIIEIWPRSWPQYRYDSEDLPAWDHLVTVPVTSAEQEGTVTIKHQIPLELIREANVKPGEKYRVRLTDLCLGTKWYTYGSQAELEGKRLTMWRSEADLAAAAEDDAVLDDETKEEIRLERQEKHGDRPAVCGENPATLALVPEVGEVEFGVVD